jgi:hypothetical protein
MTRRCLRLCTSRAPFTVPTVLIGELNANDGILPSILACAPCRAGFAPRAGDLLGFPIDVELTDVVGLAVLGLPGDIGADRANERNMEIPRTLHEQGRVHVAGIDNMRLWGELFVSQRLVDWLRHGDICDSRFRRLDMGNNVEGIVITRLGHMHFVPSPGDTTFIPEVRIGGHTASPCACRPEGGSGLSATGGVLAHQYSIDTPRSVVGFRQQALPVSSRESLCDK